MMGFLTLSITMFWKTTFLTNPLLGLAHVFILTPLSDPEKIAFVRVTFSTPFSSTVFPKLPMLVQTCTLRLLDITLLILYFFLCKSCHFSETLKQFIMKNCQKKHALNYFNLKLNLRSWYLTPWPGPHLMLEMKRLQVASPMDMQSSPVCKVHPLMVTPVERST